MATLEESFKQVLSEFKKRLNPEELARFQFTTLNDLKVAARDVQDEQRKSKTARNLTKIQPFLQAMAQYQDIIEVFLNASDFLCFVWGPMKFMLLVSLSLLLISSINILCLWLTDLRLQAIGANPSTSFLIRISSSLRISLYLCNIAQCSKRTNT